MLFEVVKQTLLMDNMTEKRYDQDYRRLFVDIYFFFCGVCFHMEAPIFFFTFWVL